MPPSGGEADKLYFPPRFDQRLAIELGQLILSAHQQYEHFVSPGEWQLPEGYELIRTIDYSSARVSHINEDDKMYKYLQKIPLARENLLEDVPVGYLARSRKGLFIIFRGTQNQIEWANNIQIKLTPHPDAGAGQVHEGFLNLYLDIREELLEAVAAFPSKIRIYVAGYSLGATFACFAAYDIETLSEKKIQALYTFGSPRLADDRFTRTFNKKLAARSFRIANSSDMVTQVPFPTEFSRVLGGFFSHVDTHVGFNVQHNDRMQNHDLETYLSAVRAVEENPVSILLRRFL
jgi:triacylglycerol lipase